MKYFQFAKLVRDRIIEHIEADGQIPHGVRRLEDTEYIKELSRKLIEEAEELADANGIEELKEELADVQEVLDHLKKTLGMDDKDLKDYQEKKNLKNGTFQERIYIESVSMEDDNEWIEYYQARRTKYPEIKKD